MDFSSALLSVKAGKKATRTGWNGKDMWIGLASDSGYGSGNQITDQGSMDRPFLFMKTVNDEYVPWVASQTDILADDWQIVK